MYRIRYWFQETQESGRWCSTGTMSLKSARKVRDLTTYENAQIVPDSEFAICTNCSHWSNGACAQYMHDVFIVPDNYSCIDWADGTE